MSKNINLIFILLLNATTLAFAQNPIFDKMKKDAKNCKTLKCCNEIRVSAQNNFPQNTDLLSYIDTQYKRIEVEVTNRNDKIKADKELADKKKADKEAADRRKADKELADKKKADKEAADRIKADRELADKKKADKEVADRIKADKELADKKKADKEADDRIKADKELADKKKADKEADDKIRAEKELADEKKTTDLSEFQRKEKDRLISERKKNADLADFNLRLKRYYRKKEVFNKKIIITSGIGVVSGSLAYILDKRFDNSLKIYNEISLLADPENDGKIVNQKLFEEYNKAYSDVLSYRNKRSLFVASGALAILAGIYDTFVIINKPSKPINYSIKPNKQSLGLTFTYNF